MYSYSGIGSIERTLSVNLPTYVTRWTRWILKTIPYVRPTFLGPYQFYLTSAENKLTTVIVEVRIMLLLLLMMMMMMMMMMVVVVMA